jgi:glutamate dehydrogenase/leucine dehydrogenase
MYTMEYSDDKNKVFLFEHNKLNCHCIIAKNNQIDLPGLGGTRFITYNDLAAAIDEAKALATSMLFKNVIAKLPFTGAKQIIFCKDKNISKKKRTDILLYSADCVNSLKGDFITGTDMGLTANDVSLMAKISPYILHGEAGDTAFDTAIGVMEGLLSMLNLIIPDKRRSDLRVLVQGVGKVGSHIAKLLNHEGMQIYISEVNREQGLKICEVNNAVYLPEISQFKGHIFTPCAIGNTVNYNLMKNMGVSIVAGSANNQLSNLNDDLMLTTNGIFYAPDFVINSGGAIHAAASYLNWGKSKLMEKIKLIPQQLREIYNYALKNKIGTYQAAKEYALANFNTTCFKQV